MRRHIFYGLVGWVCFSLLIGPAYPGPAVRRAAPPPMDLTEYRMDESDPALPYIRAVCLMVGLLMFFCLYFLPTLVAALRGKERFFAIFFFNVFLGWMPVVWLLTLLSALCRDAPRYTRGGPHASAYYYGPPRP